MLNISKDFLMIFFFLGGGGVVRVQVGLSNTYVQHGTKTMEE